MRVYRPVLPSSHLGTKILSHRPDHDNAKICLDYFRFLTPLLIDIQYIPLDTPLFMRYKDLKLCQMFIRSPELVIGGGGRHSVDRTTDAYYIQPFSLCAFHR